MFERLSEIMKELNRSIFEGERYEKNMRGITYVAMLIVVFNIATGYLNLMSGYYKTVASSVMFIFGGLVILYFTLLKRNRTGAVIAAFIAVVVCFTFEVLTVSHGFPIFWTLLLPFAFCYLADVKTGILLSLYFLVLYGVLFLTPMRDVVPAQYSNIIAQRFPILYLADVVLTAYIMVQYHLTTLRQMDDAAHLQESRETANRANAAKSEFLAQMSHEIRTPINAVLGMNEMIIRESSQGRKLPSWDVRGMHAAFEDISTYAQDVQSAGGNLLSIINDILDFSKIEAGKTDIIDAPYKLSSMLDDVVNLVLFKTREKGLEFTVDVDESIPDELCGDQVHVRQAIANILSNAVKYTERGSVRLAITCEVDGRGEPGQAILLHIAVSDTGIGIKPEDIDKLFAKFERVDLDRNSTIEGAGLGLAIARELMALMGGGVRVESEYGAGSTFTIDLPQVIVSSEPIGHYQTQCEKSAHKTEAYEETFRAPDARILIVDDTRMNLTVAVGLLKGTGLQIDTAGSGKEAVDLAGKNAYDLILMDQRMPEMDGTEAMRRIQSKEGGPNRDTPFICLTADAVIGAKERYLAEGFADYLPKPIDSKELEQMMIRHLPDDLVVPATRKVGTADAHEIPLDGSNLDAYAPLHAAGIDPETGLGYCQGNESLYRSLLEEYVYSSDKKACEMARCREERDLENLGILVHAVKSSSRTIGAVTLSDCAARVERAADAGDREAMENDFPQMMTLYEEAVSAIRQMIPPAGEPTLDDDEIIEFFPDQAE